MVTLPKTDLLSRLVGCLLIGTLPAAAAFAAEPALPAGQVWQCTVNGQRTFSDKRCGAGASVRQINDVNRMDPTPAMPIHFYGSPNQNDSSPGAEIEERGAADNTEQIYSTPPVIVVNRPGIAPRTRPHPRHHSHAHK